MIGTCLGLALAPLKLKVAVVEAVARSAPSQPSFDERSTALSRSSQRMFEAMGLWPQIVAASTPIDSIHVSERGGFGFAHIDAAEQQLEALGYVVINRVLGGVLQEALATVSNVDIFCPGKISAVAANSDFNVITVDEPGRSFELKSRLLVAADGAKSNVRDMIGISAACTDYEQWAVIGNLLPEKAHRNRAYERFTGDGVVAILPIADQRVAFVWVRPPDAAKAMLAAGDAEFLHSIESAFGRRLGRFSKVGARAAYPLALSKSNGLYAGRGVVIGNAAHGLHPVAAQGFNLGLRDVAALCDCIVDSRSDDDNDYHGFDCGKSAILENYATWRASDHKKVVRFTDGVVRLFADQRPSVRILRNIGMLAFDLIPGARNLFARHTMGLAGRLPRLSRGVSIE